MGTGAFGPVAKERIDLADVGRGDGGGYAEGLDGEAPHAAPGGLFEVFVGGEFGGTTKCSGARPAPAPGRPRSTESTNRHTRLGRAPEPAT